MEDILLIREFDLFIVLDPHGFHVDIDPFSSVLPSTLYYRPKRLKISQRGSWRVELSKALVKIRLCSDKKNLKKSNHVTITIKATFIARSICSNLDSTRLGYWFFIIFQPISLFHDQKTRKYQFLIYLVDKSW